MKVSRLTSVLPVVLALYSFPLPGLSMTKQELKDKYKNKYLVVMREGLALYVSPAYQPGLEVELIETIEGDRATYSERTETFGQPLVGLRSMNRSVNNGASAVNSIHKGFLLGVKKVYVQTHRGDFFWLVVESVPSYSMTQGTGASQHQVLEGGRAYLRFPVEKGDCSAVAVSVDHWFRVFDSSDEAAKFSNATMGNTASGVFVKEVKLGMTFAEVEAVLGVPEAKVDLGSKVLYKYKDMTVEFHDSRVADVK